MTPPSPDVSKTDWHRLVPYPRDKTLTSGLRSEVHDPLWLLGRQWQAGEFQGEDAGTPVRVEAWIEEAPLERVDLAPDDDGVEPFPYDPRQDGPLEALVEREPVTGDGPPGGPSLELAAEAGRYLLVLLEERLDGAAPSLEDFEASLHLQAPSTREAVDTAAERYMDVMQGRSLDGHAVYAELTDASNIAEVDDPEKVEWDESPTIPGDVEGSAAYRDALKDFVDWYGDLYDEPGPDEGGPGSEVRAWDPDRMEYRFRVRAGEGDQAVWLSARGYPGGRLDRDDFLVEGMPPGGEAPDPEGSVPLLDLALRDEASPDQVAMPSQMRFPGQPSTRWWAFEDGDANLGAITTEPGKPGKLLATEYALLYGNDWFSFSLDVDLGSLTRLEKLLVTDTFGIVTEVPPVSNTTEQGAAGDHGIGQSPEADPLGHAIKGAGCWNLFSHATDRGHALLVPPVLGANHESDPVERVVLARDEMANLGFGVELKTEGALGEPIPWDQHRRPTLTVRRVDASEDPRKEKVVLVNPGRASLDLDGWVVEARDVDGAGTSPAYTFGEGPAPAPILGPGEQLTLHTGEGTAVQGHRYWDRGAQEGTGDEADGIWGRAASLAIFQPAGETEEGDPSRLVEEVLLAGEGPSHPRYRLVSDVHENWFPLPMVDEPSAGSGVIGDRRFELGVLVDADLQTAVPAGRILEPGLSLHEEELTRVGVEVTRSYQYTRWLNGHAYLWSARRAGPGRGEGSSGLRYDILDEER